MNSEELSAEEEAPSTQPMSRLWWLEDTEPMDAEPSRPSEMISPAARTFIGWLETVSRR